MTGFWKQGRLKHIKTLRIHSCCGKRKIELTLHHTYFICKIVIFFIELVKIYTSNSDSWIIFFKCHYTNAYFKINRIWHRKLCTELRTSNEFLRFHSVVQSRIPVFWDVMPSYSRVSERQRGTESSKMKATSFHETSATTYRATQRHILKDRNTCSFKLHLKIIKQWMLLLWAQWYLGCFLRSIVFSINKL